MVRIAACYAHSDPTVQNGFCETGEMFSEMPSWHSMAQLGLATWINWPHFNSSCSSREVLAMASSSSSADLREIGRPAEGNWRHTEIKQIFLAKLRLSYQLDVEYSRSCHCTAPSLSVPKIFCWKRRGLWSVPTKHTEKLQKTSREKHSKAQGEVFFS